ncbi:MAG: transporter, partial [Caulobacteraceae bacterium]
MGASMGGCRIWPADPVIVMMACGSILAAPAAMAQEASPLQPICADRPTKSNGPCTVDQGHFQIEADIVNASFMNVSGMETDNWLLLNPTLKYGLTPKLDIEVNVDPLEIVHTRDAKGVTTTQSGISDTYFRAKYEFLNAADVQAAVMP